MRHFVLAVLFVNVWVFTQPVRAGIITGPITNPSNGHAYYLLTENNWTGSEAEAIGLGGHLVTINDAAENTWVVSTFATFGGVPRALWIGLSDAANEGEFVWASGEPVGFTNWGPGEPNNDGPGEDRVLIFPPLDNRFPFWNDAQDRVGDYPVTNGVVEVTPVPEPGSLFLFSVALGSPGLAGLCRRYRKRNRPGNRTIARNRA